MVSLQSSAARMSSLSGHLGSGSSHPSAAHVPLYRRWRVEENRHTRLCRMQQGLVG